MKTLLAIVNGFSGYQTSKLSEESIYNSATDSDDKSYIVDTETTEANGEVTRISRKFATTAEAWQYISYSLGL